MVYSASGMEGVGETWGGGYFEPAAFEIAYGGVVLHDIAYLTTTLYVEMPTVQIAPDASYGLQGFESEQFFETLLAGIDGGAILAFIALITTMINPPASMLVDPMPYSNPMGDPAGSVEFIGVMP